MELKSNYLQNFTKVLMLCVTVTAMLLGNSNEAGAWIAPLGGGGIAPDGGATTAGAVIECRACGCKQKCKCHSRGAEGHALIREAVPVLDYSGTYSDGTASIFIPDMDVLEQSGLMTGIGYINIPAFVDTDGNWYEICEVCEEQKFTNYQEWLIAAGKWSGSINIATVMVSHPQYISSWNINTNCLKNSISKALNCYVESIMVCPDLTDPNYYIFSFVACCNDNTILNGETRLKKINGDLFIDANDYVINVMNQTPIMANATLINSIDCEEYSNKETTKEETKSLQLISSLKINPNPTNGNTILTVELSESCSINVVVVDISGKEMMKIHDGFAGKTFTKTINTENLAKGTYFITVTSGTEKLTKSIIIGE